MDKEGDASKKNDILEKAENVIYTTEQVVKIIIATMFSTFVQSASCGIDVKVHA